MTTLVFGRSGQVAKELQKLANVVAIGRDTADLSDPEACADAIRAHHPPAVINAAAYTDVARAEAEEDLATVINGHAPAAMAVACAELDIPFVHISTDYVFSGTGSLPWKPEDTPAPQSAYGRSKLSGEQGVVAAGGRYAVIRTSWVFSAYGTNFVKTMLRLADARERLSVVNDQIGGPTPARTIAAACLSMAQQLARDVKKSGTYHFSGGPDVSWYEFAAEIFRQGNRNTRLTPIATHDHPTSIKRPLNSRLDCQRTEQVFGLKRPDWQQALTYTIQELEEAR